MRSFLPLVGVQHVRAGLEGAGIDAEERELADERVGGDLEREGAEVGAVVGAASISTSECGRRPWIGGTSSGDGQVVHHRVEHGLDALVLERGAGEHRDPLVAERGHADAVLDLVLGELLALEVLVGKLVVHVGARLEQVLAVLGRLVARSAGMSSCRSVAQVVAPDEGLHADEVHHALEAVLGADRDLDRHGLDAQAVLDHLDVAPEVGARAVELVDEADARHAVAVRLPPDRLGLRLDAGDTVEDDHRAVEHPQAALHLDGEVHVPGRIDNVDAVIVPRRRS